MTYRLYEVQNHPKTIGSLAYSWGVSAFTDTGLLNGFVFSFSINPLVWFVQ